MESKEARPKDVNKNYYTQMNIAETEKVFIENLKEKILNIIFETKAEICVDRENMNL